MKLLRSYMLFILLKLAFTNPVDYKENHNEVMGVNNLDKEHVIYTSEYDIVNIILPVDNSMVCTYKRNCSAAVRQKPVLFFALADNQNGQKIEKGLYIRREDDFIKLLDNGRDVVSANDGSLVMYIAASDGIYSYDSKNNKIEKFGSITDSIIAISKAVGSDEIYVLTEEKMVYKITEKGTKKEKLLDDEEVEQMVLDNQNHLYYLSNNNIKIYDSNGIKSVGGLPNEKTYVKLMKTPVTVKNRIPVVINDHVYTIHANGTGELTTDIHKRSIVCSIEGFYLLYYGKNKKIYEYDITLTRSIFDELKDSTKVWSIIVKLQLY